MLFSLTGSSDSHVNVSDPLQMGSKYEEQQKNWHRILCMTISPTLEKLTESELSLNPHDRLTTVCEPALVKEMSFCRIGHWGAAWAADSSALTDSLDVLVGFFTHQTGCDWSEIITQSDVLPCGKACSSPFLVLLPFFSVSVPWDVEVDSEITELLGRSARRISAPLWSNSL